MYQLLIEAIVPKVEDDRDSREYPPVNSLFVAMKPLQAKGLMIGDKIVTERRLVNVETIGQQLTFQLLNASGLVVGHAYIKLVK